MCNPMHRFYRALPAPCVVVLVTRGALVAHWHTYAPHCCRTSRYLRTFIALSFSLSNDIAEFVGINAFFIGQCYSLHFCLLFSFLLFIFSRKEIFLLYPEYPDRQCVGLAFRRSRVRASLAAVSLVILARAIRLAHGVLSCVGWGVMTSQLDLPSLMPLSVAAVVNCNWELPIGLLQ